jgi:hypothetical protein
MWEPNAVDASLLATGVALLSVLITNQSKVSEFRQRWIDALREDAATLITHMRFVHGSKILNESSMNLSESYIQLNQVMTRIRLRLNPKEKESQAIIAAMNKMSSIGHHPSQIPNVAEFQEQFVVAVQKVLRKEWKRVKYGEPLYRFIFGLAVAGVLVSVSAYIHQNFNWFPFLPTSK